MAEKDTTPSEARTPGPELRLVDRRAFVGFPELKLAPGVTVSDFALQIPDITFPLNVSGGASRYQKKKLDFGFLELFVDAEVVQRAVHKLASKVSEVDELKLHFRTGSLEVQARLKGPERTPLTFKVAFDGDGGKLAVYFYDVRFYGWSTTPAARMPALLSEAVKALEVLPEVERRGANGFTAALLPTIVEQAAVGRGYKMPSLDQARLAEAQVSSKGLRLRFSAGGLPPPANPDEELLLTLEGARAFADAEELVAEGKLAEAREAYLRLGDATEAHPFAVERLLTLLVADGKAHELALDIAASLQRRREQSATGLWAEAVIRERRGEFARASERYLALCALARRQQEEASAFYAAEAGARSAREHAPQMAVRALHELLGLRPDHVPSLKALARASDQAKDRAGAIRAYRRLAALARDAADAAEAHVNLARLCAQTEDDIAGARLHCEAALRLSPDHPDALLQLGELCARSGEHLRAIKALDRLREVAMARHEVDRVGRANLLAGKVWETGLKQAENALLRYREAASLLPGEPEPLFFSGRVAESLGRVQEAVAAYQQCVELAGPAPRTDEIRSAAHASHHALARILKTKLGEPARGREHLEAALALDATDTLALDELLPYFRASGKAAELADACEKAAAVLSEPKRRAALWAEAGELYRGRLAQPERAERLLSQALEADPKNKVALEGMLAVAEAKRDGGQLCRCLRALAELADEPKERVRHYRRLAVAARDLAFDLDLAAHAYRKVLDLEPDDLPVLGELTALERRKSDMGGLAWALEQRARAAEGLGDKRLAAAALRELGLVLDARLGRGAEALVAFEKAARLHPDALALLDLAALSMRLERPVNARRALEDALALLPRHAAPEKLAEVRARLGQACEALGDLDAAKEHYAQAFPLRRLDDELWKRLEALLVAQGSTRELTDFQAARAQALLAAGRAQDAAPLFLNAAKALLTSGDPAGAMLRLASALDAAPQGDKAAEVLEAMGAIELERGGLAEASRLYARRAALSTDAREAARWLFRAATLVKDTPREVPLLAQALEKDGTYVPARLRRAELSEADDPKGAFADLEMVLEASAEDPDALGAGLEKTALTRRLAFAALKVHNFDAARRHLSHYVAKRSDDAEAVRELVKLHRRAGALEPLVDLLAELWPRLEGDERTQARRELVEGALSLGRREQAALALRSILVDLPRDAWAAERLLALLPEDAPHDAERLDLVSRLVDGADGERRAELLARRAELLRHAGDLRAARTDLLEASRLSPRPVPLLKALAELARQSRDEPAELAAWKLVLERAGADAHVRAEVAERLLGLAVSALQLNELGRAVEAYEAVVTLPLEPVAHLDAWLGLARAARALGNTRRSEDALLEASKQGPVPRRVDALLERASLQESRGAQGDAVDTYGAVLELVPAQPVATDGLRKGLAALGDWAGLAEVLADLAARAPKAEAAQLYGELSRLYLERLQQPGPAEAALRRVVGLDDANAAARISLARLLVEKGDSAAAIEHLEQAAARVAPDEAARLLREAAVLAKGASDLTKELTLLRRAHQLVPAVGEAQKRLAEALYLHGAVKEALPLTQAIAAEVSFEDSPEEAEQVSLRLADLAEQTGDLALAEKTLRTLVRERPLHTQGLERLAALVAEKDPRGALEMLARHVEGLAPSARRAERLLELARQAAKEVQDLDLAVRLYGLAGQSAQAPLPVRLEALALLREANRTADVLAALPEIAQLQLAEGKVDAALAAWDEEARLAEGLGRIDLALQTLTAMAELCEEESLPELAAKHLVKKAELLRDSKLDLDGAEKALGKAWELFRDADVAATARELARRRGDREGEIDWLERSLEGIKDLRERAMAFVQLAALHLGLASPEETLEKAPLLAPEQAEAALEKALELAPGLPTAQALLLALYERQDRVGDIAAFHEDLASRETNGAAKAALLMKAAELYKDRAGRPADAVGALLAARSASPDDLTLTARVADLLHELGRTQDAADFDAVLLEANPFHPVFERARAHLVEAGDDLTLAGLLVRRAERQSGDARAASWLEAGDAFRRAGAKERAQLCEAQAFESAPGNATAFERVLVQAQGEPRRQADLIAARARAVPTEARALLRRRAGLVVQVQEPLLAAEAWDDYLQVAPDDAEALEARAELAFAGGGPRASQPFDRRLLAAGGEALPAATRLRVFLRLGQASLESKAWRDAAEALESALSLAPKGPAGKDALSLLTEAYARLGDAAGQYRTALRLAGRLEGAEAEALYRRAVSFAAAPEEAVEALEVLLALHPGEASLYEAFVKALQAKGRLGDLLLVHERFAEATGGATAARALLAAAKLSETELSDAEKAFELRQRAVEADPDNADAAQAALFELRRRGDTRGLIEVLARILPATRDEVAASGIRLELATHLEKAGQGDEAARVLEAVRQRGAKAAGYEQALLGLERLATARGDEAAVARYRVEAAELLGAQAKAALLLEAARGFERAGATDEAIATVKAALAVRTSKEGLAQLVRLLEQKGDAAERARSLVQLALEETGAERAARFLDASEAWEAAGSLVEAKECLERALAAEAGVLSWKDSATRLVKLGAVPRAVELGFDAALEAQDFGFALALAEAAEDAPRVERALWAQLEARSDVQAAVRLAALVRERGDVAALARLASKLGPADAKSLLEELVFTHHHEASLMALVAAGSLSAVVDQALAKNDARVLDALVPSVAALPLEERERVLSQVVRVVPARRRALLPELASLRAELGNLDGAAAALAELVPLVDEPRARAAVRVQRGELLSRVTGRAAEARAAFEAALADDASQLVAVRALVELTKDAEPERFVAMVERLGALAGPEAARPHAPKVADAYQALGRVKEAYQLLGELAETPDRLRRRAELAERLGLTGEALALKEKVFESRPELEQVLKGYLELQLVPFAVRLGTRLLAEGPLSPKVLRLLAERLSSTEQGAALAVRVWPQLLSANVDDADGWTLLAEALVRVGKGELAGQADGFGAALTDSEGQAPFVEPTPVAGPVTPSAEPAPSDAVEVSMETMPRLAHALDELLTGFGLAPRKVVLDPAGGVEAWLAQDGTMVLGAGTLGAFGQGELAALVALAATLGPEGPSLRGIGDVPAVDAAAVRAFQAFPSSLALARVLAQLDGRVRGGDPLSVQASAVLPECSAFRAVALAVLEACAREST